MEWPERFYALKRGDGCAFCEQGRPGETPYGVRFYAGEVTDGYLQRAAIRRGYSIVVWRGRHVVEPTELEPQKRHACGRPAVGLRRRDPAPATRVW